MNRESKKKSSIRREQAFTNSFRFIDDLALLNNGSEFKRSFQVIYTDTESSFLYLGIKIENNRFSMSHYDKEDNFCSSIVRMPYLSNNIYATNFYYEFGAETSRSRTMSKCNEFPTSPKTLLKKGRNHSGKSVALKRGISKYFERHCEVFQKFNDTSSTIKSSLLGNLIA